MDYYWKKIDPETIGCWRKCKELKTDAYGRAGESVFLACDRSSRRIIVKSANEHDPHALVWLEKEHQFLALCNGIPNVIQCLGQDYSVEMGDDLYNLFVEYAPGETLRDLIKRKYNQGLSLPETHVAFYASMLLRGLAGIHSQGIVHCDLNPGTILEFPAVYGGELISELKIADFSTAIYVSQKNASSICRSYGSGTMTYNRTTLVYASPESVTSGDHGTCTDIWSFGCIVYEMITGKPIWKDGDDKMTLIDQILHGSIDIAWKFSNTDGVDFLQRCLERDPEKRWSATELLKHPFIVKNLKIMSNNHGVDFEGIDRKNCFQANPFGNRWVSKNLFSKPTTEVKVLQPRHQPRADPKLS